MFGNDLGSLSQLSRRHRKSLRSPPPNRRRAAVNAISQNRSRQGVDIRFHFALIHQLAPLARIALHRPIDFHVPRLRRRKLQLPEVFLFIHEGHAIHESPCILTSCPTSRIAVSVDPPRKRMISKPSVANLCLEMIPAPCRLSVTVCVSSEKTVPVQSIPSSRMRISFAIRPLRRPFPIGGRWDGQWLYRSATKNLYPACFASSRGHGTHHEKQPK